MKAALDNMQMSSYSYVPIKLFAKAVEDKRLISRIYEELLKFNNQKTTRLKNRQRTSIDISQKKIYEWTIRT